MRCPRWAKGSVILLCSGIADAAYVPDYAGGAAICGAVNAMGKNLAVELAPRGIRVNVLSPGFIIGTDIKFNLEDEKAIAFVKRSIADTPLPYHGYPEGPRRRGHLPGHLQLRHRPGGRDRRGLDGDLSTMKNHRTQLALSTLLICAALSSGCSTMKLRYDEPPASEPVKGEISIVLEDRRPANRGGDEPLRVGTIRNTFGMPFALAAAAGREPPRVVEELVSDCLEASGYRVVGAAAGVPQLRAALEAFWTDGYQHSRMILELPLELRRNESAPPVWSHHLESNTGVTWTVGYGQFDRGFSRTLNEAKQKLIAEFSGPGFAEGYASLR